MHTLPEGNKGNEHGNDFTRITSIKKNANIIIEEHQGIEHM